MNKTLFTEIIKKKPYLAWWIKDKSVISDELLVEIVLNYGDFPDVKLLFSEFGLKKVFKIYKQQISRPRNNYKKKTINYFNHYFRKYV